MKEYIELLQKLSTRINNMIAACHDAATLKGRLEHLQEDLLYTAPEVIGNWGLKVENALISEFGPIPPTEGWQKKVVDAWVI